MKLIIGMLKDIVQFYIKNGLLILAIAGIVSNAYLIKDTEVYKKAENSIKQFWKCECEKQKQAEVKSE